MPIATLLRAARHAAATGGRSRPARCDDSASASGASARRASTTLGSNSCSDASRTSWHRPLVERLPRARRPSRACKRRWPRPSTGRLRQHRLAPAARRARRVRRGRAAFATFKGTERALYLLQRLPREPRRAHDASRSPATSSSRTAEPREPASTASGSRARSASSFRTATRAPCGTQLATARGPGQTFVVTESLFSMDGDVPPLADYAACAGATGALLIVDEAHAVGIYGARGSGLIEDAGIDARRVRVRSTPPARRSA